MNAQIIQFPLQGRFAAIDAFFGYAVDELNHWREPDDETDELLQPLILSTMWTRWARNEGFDEELDWPDLRAIMNRIYHHNRRYAAHWSDHDQHIFDHMVKDGYSFQEAAEHIEAAIQDRKDADALPLGKDRLLFLASRAILRAKKIDN